MDWITLVSEDIRKEFPLTEEKLREIINQRFRCDGCKYWQEQFCHHHVVATAATFACNEWESE